MKEPLKYTLTLTDADGKVKASNTYEDLKTEDVVAMQETVAAALNALGRSKIKK